MGLFGDNQKNQKKSEDPRDQKIADLENEAQKKMQLIGSLRAQISQLKNDEQEVQKEWEQLQPRLAALRARKEQIARLKEEETILTKDCQLRCDNLEKLKKNLSTLQQTRHDLAPQIAQLRASVSNEEECAKNDIAELSRLEKIHEAQEARKQKILADLEFTKKSDTEIKELEEKYKTISEQIPQLRKKYEQTKQLVKEMEKNSDPIAQAVLAIWQKLPPDVLDKRLTVAQFPR